MKKKNFRSFQSLTTCPPLPEGNLPGPLSVISCLSVDDATLPIPRLQKLRVSTSARTTFAADGCIRRRFGGSVANARRIKQLVLLDRKPWSSSASYEKIKMFKSLFVNWVHEYLISSCYTWNPILDFLTLILNSMLKGHPILRKKHYGLITSV